MPRLTPGAVAPRHLPHLRAAAIGLAAVAAGAVLLQLAPRLQLEVFARATARLAAFFTGVPLGRSDAGWVLDFPDRVVVVSAACSGTHYFLMVAGLLGWRLFGHGKAFALAAAAGLALAFPLTVLINAVRVVAVAQAHRWVIPLLPDAHGAFAHMFTGVAVFLPALIALNLLLEYHGNRRRASPSA